MKAIFEEYGALIIIVFVAVALIGITGLMFNESGSGWVQSAFQETGLAEKATSDNYSEAFEELAMRTYSKEEIDKSTYMYAIGDTCPEYIVASFNKDFTRVTVFKNGTLSDGRCADYMTTATSVFTQFYAEELSSVVIEMGVTNISDNLFYNCTNLTSVAIPESVTSISEHAFTGCTSLTTICGVRGSFAETFAIENGYTFITM